VGLPLLGCVERAIEEAVVTYLSGRFPQAGLVSTAEFGQRRISPT